MVKKLKPKKRKINYLLTKSLDITSEILMGESKLTLIGRKQLIIENHIGVIEYTEKCIRIKTDQGILMIEGNDFSLKNFGKDDVFVVGKIDSFKYTDKE